MVYMQTQTHGRRTSYSKRQLPAHTCSIQVRPEAVTHSPPHPIKAQLHPTLELSSSIYQTNISIHTWASRDWRWGDGGEEGWVQHEHGNSTTTEVVEDRVQLGLVAHKVYTQTSQAPVSNLVAFMIKQPIDWYIPNRLELSHILGNYDSRGKYVTKRFTLRSVHNNSSHAGGTACSKNSWNYVINNKTSS